MHLDKILAHKRRLWADAVAPYPLISGRSKPVLPNRFAAALTRPEVAIIAEVKPKSPSKGDLFPIAQAATLASTYAAYGAAAISVLADEEFFGGGPELVRMVADTVAIPVMFKDFVVDVRQVELAHACNADAILAIVRAVDDTELVDIIAAAKDVGLDILVETFTDKEVQRALTCGATIIGVNNRDLDSFTVDLSRSASMRKLIPDEVLTVSESGLKNRADIGAVARDGYDACLIGETLLTSKDVGGSLRELVGVPSRRAVAA